MTASIWAHDKIQTLRVKARDGDTPALRLALMQTLASVNLHPAGMSPSAVFMIHYLEDPLPGKLINRKQNAGTWRSALRDNIDMLYRQAATPKNCALNGDPVAVLFRDQAELLACLVVDICAQRVGQHWWWRRWNFSSAHSSQRIHEALIYKIRYVPAIFAQLASTGRALDVIKQLEPAHANDLLQRLLNEFSLGSVRELIAEIEYEDDAINERTNIASQKNSQPRDHWPQTKSHSMPPWAALFTKDTWQANLPREQAALLGVACTLHERPAIMRNRVFQRSLAHWWVDENKPTANSEPVRSIGHSRTDFLKKDSLGKIIVVEPDNNQHTTSKKSTQPRPAQKNSTSNLKPSVINTKSRFLDTDNNPGQLQAENLAPFPRGKDISPSRKNGSHQGIDSSIQNDGQSGSQNSAMHLDEKDVTETKIHREHARDLATTELMETVAPHRDQGTKKIAALDKNTLSEEYLENSNEVNLHFSDAYIDTQLGGIIFLINLVQQLGLPECFARHWQLEQQLGPWALVDVLARALLEKKFALLYQDPIWRALAKLDGRRTKLQIAHKFSGHADYRIPQRWYEWLQDGQIYWARSRNNIRIWTHDCVLVDATYTGDALTACIAEMQVYDPEFNVARLQQASYRQAPLQQRSNLQANGLNTELARMLALMMPFVFTFLRRQLQLPAAHRRDLARELLHLDARIYLSSSHIDLVTGIDNTRFKLRFAGLDQDPGWLPDYGRVVLIHFS